MALPPCPGGGAGSVTPLCPFSLNILGVDCPSQKYFAWFSNILCKFNLCVFVVLAPVSDFVGFSLLTVEGVCTPWLWTLAAPFPLAGKTAVSAALVALPRGSYLYFLFLPLAQPSKYWLTEIVKIKDHRICAHDHTSRGTIPHPVTLPSFFHFAFANNSFYPHLTLLCLVRPV